MLLGPDRPFHFVAADSAGCRLAVAAICHLGVPVRPLTTAVLRREDRAERFGRFCNVPMAELLR